jgi:hypothetical protein
MIFKQGLIFRTSKNFNDTKEVIQYYELSIQLINNLPWGNVFQAIVSVMAVKIQFSSPNIVRLSLNCPGTLQNSSLY